MLLVVCVGSTGLAATTEHVHVRPSPHRSVRPCRSIGSEPGAGLPKKKAGSEAVLGPTYLSSLPYTLNNLLNNKGFRQWGAGDGVCDQLPSPGGTCRATNSWNFSKFGGVNCRWMVPSSPCSSTTTSLASASEVVVELQGEEGTIQRQFTPPNFERFQEFVALHVPPGDGS